MELKNMKVENKPEMCEATAIKGPSCEYPYGLCLYLNEQTIKALGLKEMPKFGDELKIEAKVRVNRVTESNSLYGVDRSIDLQITDMGIGGKAEKE